MNTTSLAKCWIAFPGLSGAAHHERAALLRSCDGAVMLTVHASQKRRPMLRLTCDDFKKRRKVSRRASCSISF
jgi:hypothetical protein